MDELRNFLKQFDACDDKEPDESLTCFKKVQIRREGFYVKEGDVCKKAAFIKKELLKLYYNPDGVERIMLFFQENQLVADYYSFLTQTPGNSPIQAIEDSVIYNVTYNDFQKLFDRSKQWERVGRMLAERAYICSVQRANRIFTMIPMHGF